MQPDKLIQKAYDFFNGNKKKQLAKADKLADIVKKFEQAKKELKEKYKRQTSAKRKKLLVKEYKVISNLLKKAKKRYRKITMVKK